MILSRLRQLVLVLCLGLTLCSVPSLAFAQVSGPQAGLDQIKEFFPSGSKLSQATTVGGVITEVVRILLALVLVVDVLFIIIGGYMYITSAGNEDRAKKGRRTLMYAVVGLAVIVMSYVIATFVGNFLNSSGGA